MDERNLEGTLVLEKLAEVGQVNAFFEAVDNDDFAQAVALMKRAGIEAETIETVLKAMAEQG